jgi:uncharacterized protein
MAAPAHEFTIPVSDLDAGGREYHFEVRPAWVNGALEDHEAKATTKVGKLDIRASKSAQDVVVHGTLDAEVRVTCGRCTEPFDLPIHSDLSVLYVPRSELKAPKSNDKDEYEFSAEEADTLPYSGETVVLDDLVRDELMLEIPMIPLCSEGCPGISPPPGEETAKEEEKGIDPRLAPLMQFRAKKKS